MPTKIFPFALYRKFSFIVLLASIIAMPPSTSTGMEQGLEKGTLVKTEKGYVIIEDIKKHDRVISYDLINNMPISDRVTATHQNNAAIIAQLMTHNQLVSIGRHHPIYVTSLQRWINASDMQDDAIVKTFGNEIILKKLPFISLKDKTVPLYCLSIAKNHNFFVSSEEILVHNMGGLAGLGAAISRMLGGILIGGGMIIAPRQDDINEMLRTMEAFHQKKFEEEIRSQERYTSSFGYDDVAAYNYSSQTTTIPTSFTADEIRPGNSRSITLNIHGNRYTQPEDEDWAKIQCKKHQEWLRHQQEANKKEDEEREKTQPKKIKVIEERHKGWLWGWHTNSATATSYISEQEYRENRDKITQRVIDDITTETVSYYLPPDSPLAKQLAYEDAMAQQIKDAESSLTPGCLFNPEPSIPEFLFTPVPAPIKVHEGTLFTPIPTTIKVGDQIFTLTNSSFFSNKEEEGPRETGAQAPGKPRAIDGWNPPKKWNGEKVKMQDGPLKGKAGWPDARGKIWVPTGPKGARLSHGGPHWDVAYPDGKGHENKRPQSLNCEVASSSISSSTFESSSSLSDTWSTSYSKEQVEQIQKAVTGLDEAIKTYSPEKYQTEVVDKFNNLFSGLSEKEIQSYRNDLNEIMGDFQTSVTATADLSDPIDRAIDAFSNEAERIASDKDNNTYAPNDFKDWFSHLPAEEKQSYLDDANEFMSQNKL